MFLATCDSAVHGYQGWELIISGTLQSRSLPSCLPRSFCSLWFSSSCLSVWSWLSQFVSLILLWWELGCFLLVWLNDGVSPWHAGCFLSYPSTFSFLNYGSPLKACPAWLPRRQLCMEGAMLCPFKLMTNWFTPVWFLGSSLLFHHHCLRKLYFLCVCVCVLIYILLKTTGAVKCKPCRDSAKVSSSCHSLFWIKCIHVVSIFTAGFGKLGFLKQC